MKKKFVLLCALLIGLMISGCDKKEEQPKQPEINMVVVPNMKEVVAKVGVNGLGAYLNDCGLKYVEDPVVVSGDDIGKVFGQNPLPGVCVQTNSEVIVTIGVESVEAGPSEEN